MPRRKMWVEWEEGSDLSLSRKRPGEYSPLTRDEDNNLVGQVVLSDVNEGDDKRESESGPDDVTREGATADTDEMSDVEAVLGLLAVLGVVVVVQKAGPHVQKWWTDRVVPFLKRSQPRLRRRSPIRDAAVPAISDPVSDSSTHALVTALEEYRASMSSAEARERLVLALVARLYSDEQLRVLRNARIDDDAARTALRTMETATPEELAARLTLMLESNPTWPDDLALAQLRRMLERSGDCEREFVEVPRRSAESR